MKRPIWRVAGAAAILAAVLGCPKSPPAAASGDTLARHLDGDPATLDPITINEELGLRVIEMLFRPLVAIDRERRIVPGLALSWTISNEGRTYELALDQKARWQDGTPVSSEDVRFTLDRILNPKAGAANWRPALEDLEKIETPDPATVRLTFRKAYAERLLALNLPVVCAAAYGRAPEAAARKPLGSGPYRLESWETNQKLVLLRRADASEKEAPFRRVVFRVIPDPAVRFQAGSRGELDEFRITRDQRARAAKTPAFLERNRILVVPQFLQVLILWNCRNPLLADPRVRRALATAWPRAQVARRLYPPDGAALVSGPYPAGAAENDPGVAPAAHDPEASGRLLDEAGLVPGKDGVRRKGGRKATLELLYQAGQPLNNNLVEILRSAYAKLGIELVGRPLDWAAYSQREIAGEFDAELTARQFLPPNVDPYPFFHSTQAPPRGGNVGFYANAEADRVMEEAQRELDDARRLALYRQIHRLLAADPPADFLWSADQAWAVSKSVDGVAVSPVGLFHFAPGPLAWRPAAR
ncbi:MAG: ABC transporter substrate-binding protein [Thermoanaerobaculia bacterium]